MCSRRMSRLTPRRRMSSTVAWRKIPAWKPVFTSVDMDIGKSWVYEAPDRGRRHGAQANPFHEVFIRQRKDRRRGLNSRLPECVVRGALYCNQGNTVIRRNPCIGGLVQGHAETGDNDADKHGAPHAPEHGDPYGVSSRGKSANH